MKSPIIALIVLLAFGGVASAKGNSFEHPNCKINFLMLNNGNEFGYGVDESKPATQEALRILNEKGYIYDRDFMESEANLDGETKTGLFVRIQAIYSRVASLQHYIGANGVRVERIRRRSNSERTSVISIRTMSEGSKKFMRSFAKADFFFDYMRSLPSCKINPEVNLDIVIKE